ncbi:hypothetical protein [Methylomonas sp. UP202]|uniref:nSTAND3 domain-containing NTPase n=1 Tax=Methylomonas sp. UP202 TaxID=3040943 RepID=UPI002479259C|nr:hypothetical protein [Methylomonas sp. UP202]WGS87699.1 hypothetical protein QC632_08055 [Methylomonas sp. UP202]
MSVFLQIERELQACNQARFEKVSGLLLGARGVKGIALLGSVEGKDKTRTGVPDIYATQDGKTFTFLACTTITGASAVKSKLFDDIGECSNEKKTGISSESIIKLFLAFNSNLQPAILQEIANYGATKNIEVEFLSLSEIALDLQRQYRWIAADKLGIRPDTGQFLPIDAFVKAYDHGKLATPLDTKFHFREPFVAESIEHLTATSSVLIISGPAGTGKTRLALEVAKQVNERDPTCQIHCVYNRDLPLFDDLNNYFSAPGNYLILVDDANRINGRIHILELIKQANDARAYRFILTVRDYAEKEVIRDAKLSTDQLKKLSVGPFSHKELTEYLENEFGILNDAYQIQIWNLSQGNARLATMAAKEAVKHNDLSAIRDVTELYELYFSDIATALNESEKDLFKALGIISVLRHIRQRDEETLINIQNAFGVTKENFWLSIDRLHDLEFVDLHGHEVAKVSDQILATFCFYLCFIKHKALSFENLFLHFEKPALDRIKDAVYAACNTMNAKSVLSVINNPLISAIQLSPPNEQLRLLEPFWFVDRDLTLRIIHERISKLDDLPLPEELTWDDNNFADDDSILSVLENFSHAPNEHEVSLAIDLILLYFAKRPENAGRVLKSLTKAGGFGFNRDSHNFGYIIQRMVTEQVIHAAVSSNHEALLIQVAKRFLAFEFDSDYMQDRNTVAICHYGLETCDEIIYIRTKLWAVLKDKFRQHKHDLAISSMLLDYTQQFCRNPIADILKIDSQELLEWSELLSPANYLHCVIIDKLHERLRHSGINLFDPIVGRFNCPAFEFRKLMTTDLQDNSDESLDFQTLEKNRDERIFKRFGYMSKTEIPNFIATCQEIQAANDNGYDNFTTRFCVSRLFEMIGGNNPRQLAELTHAYLELGDPLDFRGWPWIPTLIRGIGKAETKTIIEAHNFPTKSAWLLSLYIALDDCETEPEDIEQILSLLEDDTLEVPLFEVLRRYEKFETNIIPKVISLVLSTRTSCAGYALYCLLSFPGIDRDWLKSKFENDLELLKTAYFAVQRDERSLARYFDHHAKLFNLILDLAPEFISEYVKQRFIGKRWLSEFDENHRDYSCLWQRDDWPDLLIKLSDVIVAKDRFTQGYLSAWFPHASGQIIPTLSNNIEEAVLYLIQNRACNQEVMRQVFYTLCSTNEKHRLAAFQEFLYINKSLDDFKALPLKSNFMSSKNGDFITQYRSQINFIEQLKQFLNGIDFISHRAYLNEQIRFIQDQVISAEEREFIESYF